MTVSSTTTKNSYSGNGSLTVFAYGFKIFDEDDIEVILRNDSTGTETVQTITTDYSVSNVGNANGGNVTFVTAPASGITVVVRRASPLTQTTDYTPNDPFPAESHEDALDKLTFISQQLQEEVDRSIKLSRTNTMTSTEFTVGAVDRANKILAFDGNGEINVAQELGAFQGNWSSGTAFAARDIVKDTSTNNIFIANTAHTSSGSQPLTTNTDSAKWDLLVDAASATTSATAAASSATAAANSASAASTSQSNAATSETNAATSASNASTSETNAGNSATAASNAQAAAEAALDTFTDQYLGSLSSDPATDLDGNALTDGDLYFNTTDNVMKVYDLGNTIWKQLVPTTAQQANIDTVSGISGDVTTVAGIASDVTATATNNANITTVATDIANVNAVGTDIANVNTVAANLTDVNAFADTYFISATAPSSPTQGDLWFDTDPASLIMKVYDGSGWVNAGSSVNGTSERQTYTATAGQTSFAATYDAGFVDVYLNGVKLIDGTDFTATSGTSIVLASGAALNDTVDIVAYGTFTLLSTVLDDLSDVSTSGATSGQVLSYNGSSWAASTPSVSTLSSLGIDNHDDITVDGSGNVGIGTASPDRRLQVKSNENNAANTTIGLAPSTTENVQGGLGVGSGGILGVNAVNTIQFRIGGTDGDGASEVARIDSSGNLLVGTTSNTPGGTANTTGVALSSGSYGGLISATRDSGSVADFNRKTNDGAIVQFRKDGSIVGSIGVANNDIPYITCAEGTSGLRFDGDNSNIKPSNASGANLDAVISLGSGGTRFTDLYLSGGVYLGGTGSANHLDDYEEGTWTPVIFAASGNFTSTTGSGRYTKIGNTVHCWGYSRVTNVSGGTNIGGFSGLPFASINDSFPAGNRGGLGIVREDQRTGILAQAFIQAGQQNAVIQSVSGGNMLSPSNNDTFLFEVTYKTTA